jgi:hypothetical protein
MIANVGSTMTAQYTKWITLKDDPPHSLPSCCLVEFADWIVGTVRTPMIACGRYIIASCRMIGTIAPSVDCTFITLPAKSARRRWHSVGLISKYWKLAKFYPNIEMQIAESQLLRPHRLEMQIEALESVHGGSGANLAGGGFHLLNALSGPTPRATVISLANSSLVGTGCGTMCSLINSNSSRICWSRLSICLLIAPHSA